MDWDLPEMFLQITWWTFQFLRMLWFVWLPYLVIYLLRRAVFWYRNRRLARSGVAEIDGMSGKEFEIYLESLFRKLGYQVQRTPYQGDYGADLVLHKSDDEIAVQAKRYTGQVGVKAVQEAVAAKEFYRCNKAMVVTNSRFTRQARSLAKANHVVLWDRNELANHLLSLNEEKVLAPVTPALSMATFPMASAEMHGVPSRNTESVCVVCGKTVTPKVHDYCLANRERFGGRIYCYEHQKQVRRSQ